jgi:hypothetical protein
VADRRPEELVAAVREVIDETERVALAAVAGPWSFDGNPSCVVVAADGRSLSASAWNCEPPVNAANAEHIAFNNPAAVLRRVAADRRVLTRHQPYETWPSGRFVCRWCNTGNGCRPFPCSDVVDLADRYGIDVEGQVADGRG